MAKFLGMKTFIAIKKFFMNFKLKFNEDLTMRVLVLFGLLIFFSHSVDTVSDAPGDVININDSSSEDNQYFLMTLKGSECYFLR